MNRAPSSRSLSRPAMLAPALLLALLLCALDRVGYIGGGSDDWQYLEAARCIVANGWCLPHTHWAARLPMTVATAAAIGLAGETREALWLVPIAYGAIGLVCFALLVERHFGRPAAAIAAFALVATRSFGGELLALNVSLAEFAFAMAALLCLDNARAEDRRRWALSAGILAGLAVLSRSTSIALVAIMLLALLARGPRRLLLPFLAGVAVVAAFEALGYGLATGDPTFSWSLALGHTRLTSSELPPGVDLSRSPLFNPDFIAGWHRSMGIHVHWTIDGALNLLVHPEMGPTLLAALALLLLHRDALRQGGAIGRGPLWLLAAGALYFGALTYGLAIDPQPRMFLPVAAAGAAIVGVLAVQGWRTGHRAVTIALLALLAINAIFGGLNRFDMRRIERVASTWVAEAPDRFAIDETARRVLTLAPAIRPLPAFPAPNRDRTLLIARNPCAPAIATPDGASFLTRAARFSGSAYRLCEYRVLETAGKR